MGKAIFHAESSAKEFGGKPEDYLDIHEFLDSSREAFGDLRHRALTHNSWFIGKVIERIFGITRINSVGERYSVKTIAEHHVLEDFDGLFIPSAQDYLAEIELHDWMDNAKDGKVPPSRKKVPTVTREIPKRLTFETSDLRQEIGPLPFTRVRRPERNCRGKGVMD